MSVEPSGTRRILLTLDATGNAPALIDLGVEIASLLNARLHSQFVEDIDLLRIADLPCTTEITLSSATERAMDAASMLRSLQVSSARSREYLNQTADQASVQWSFNTVRGRRMESGLSEPEEYDLTIIGQAGTTHTPEKISPRRKRILLIDGDSSAMRRALELIKKLAVAASIEITMLQSGRKVDNRVLEKIQRGLNILINPPKTYQADRLSGLSAEGPDYVIVARNQSLPMLQEILRESSCPVILVS